MYLFKTREMFKTYGMFLLIAPHNTPLMGFLKPNEKWFGVVIIKYSAQSCGPSASKEIGEE